MGQSIGELFVKLGFDVDDAKLKSFDDSIQDLYAGIQKLAGYAGVGLGVAGFVELGKHASDTALNVENLTKVYGVSEQAIRSWAAAVHENNPLKSFNEGISSFATLADYLSKATYTPQGVMALNRLGVHWDSSMIGHPEAVINELFRTVPAMLKANPNLRSMYSDLIGQVTGSRENIGIFERGPQWYAAAAARAATSQEDNDRMTQQRRNIAALEDQWDKFINHVFGSIADFTLKVQAAGEKGGAKGAVAYIGEHSWIDSLGAWNPFGLGNIGGNVKGMISSGNAAGMKRYLQGKGWSEAQARGIVNRLMKESSLNPGAVGDHGLALGLAQWHPDRQANFEKWAGHSMRGSTWQEQLDFLNYELIKGNERAAGAKLRGAQNAEDAYRVFTNDYERPAVTVNVTQNIHSNDPDAAGRAAVQAIQDTITTTVVNRAPEPY